MATRTVTAAVGLLLLFVVFLLDVRLDTPLPFTALAAIAAAVAAWELCVMSREWSDRPISLLSAAASAGLVLSSLLSMAADARVETILPTLFQSTTLLGAAVALVWFLRRIPTGAAVSSMWTATAAPAMFVGGLLFHAPLLRAAEYGREWVLLLVLATFACDTGAYFVGKAIGRTPLAPNISPSKTREGAAGGLVAAVVACVALDAALGLPAVWWQAAMLGIAFGVVGQLGDLAESRIKRIAGVKDSGRLMPGHGGVLDRLDSLMFNLVVLYYFVL